MHSRPTRCVSRQGLKQRAIENKIGVSDPAVVYRYLKTAVDKLAGPDTLDPHGDQTDRRPGAHVEDVARQSGLSDGLVCWQDL